MNLPNKLTICRVILVFAIMVVPIIYGITGISEELLGIPIEFWIMNIIFIIASITDQLDGAIARKKNQVTTFGKFLDPIADKILILASLIILVEYKKIPAWIPIIISIREFVISGYRLIAVEKGGKVIAASIWGKLKTVTQILAIICCFLDKFNYGEFILRVSSIEQMTVSSAGIYMNTLQYIINIFSTVLMIIAVLATIFSGIDYLKNGKELLK